MPDRASEQLAALGETAALLEAAGIDYWLFGGWAVDFWVGAFTRAHDDLESGWPTCRAYARCSRTPAGGTPRTRTRTAAAPLNVAASASS